jgi:hypothetical protein
MTSNDALKQISHTQLSDGMTKIEMLVATDLLGGDMLEKEENAQKIGNIVSSVLTSNSLESYDIDEKTLVIGGETFYNKGRFNQVYECLNGQIKLERAVYQNSSGGTQYVPLENNAGLVNNCTPHFAKIITSKGARMGANSVVADLDECNKRKISARYVKSMLDDVGKLAQNKQETWKYEIPDDIKPEDVATVSLSVDGTSMYLTDGGGWREATVGVITLYNKPGVRLHSTYIGGPPEYGKDKFLSQLDKEWNRTLSKFPKATTQGIADGAAWIWNYLTVRTTYQVLDFYHISEYIGKAANVLHKKSEDQETFKTEWCHYIKHHHRGVYTFLHHLEEAIKKIPKMTKADKANLQSVMDYMKNQAPKTNYLREIEANRPIGSGVTEAGCKQLIKARMCQAGMRWKLQGAACVIALRALLITRGRWNQFWKKIMKNGGYRTLAVKSK